MDFSSLFGGLMGGGGSAPANKEFGSSTASTTFGNYTRQTPGPFGGAAAGPSPATYILAGVALLVIVAVALLPRK